MTTSRNRFDSWLTSSIAHYAGRPDRAKVNCALNISQARGQRRRFLGKTNRVPPRVARFYVYRYIYIQQLILTLLREKWNNANAIIVAEIYARVSDTSEYPCERRNLVLRFSLVLSIPLQTAPLLLTYRYARFEFVMRHTIMRFQLLFNTSRCSRRRLYKKT